MLLCDMFGPERDVHTKNAKNGHLFLAEVELGLQPNLKETGLNSIHLD